MIKKGKFKLVWQSYPLYIPSKNYNNFIKRKKKADDFEIRKV